MPSYNQKILKLLLSIVLLFGAVAAQAVEEFTIEDIRVVGLQRLTPGTVFNYLPIEVGDVFTDQISVESIRSLFRTGFFDDIRLERDENVLVIVVDERPAIASIEISGNEDIETESLMDSLNNVGFAVGRVFDQSQLEGLERELRRQYFSRGKYAVNVESTLEALSNNRVGVSIQITEGEAARIRSINIVGNTAFDEETLLEEFVLSPRTFFSFFTQNNQYSREELSGDLETLRSMYMDHGYVNFNIDSTQVSITPDKKDIYITINITEGEQYTVSDVKLAGELIFPEVYLFRMVLVRQGGLFSQRDITNTTEFISSQLGNQGYAFANVNSIPEINEEDKTVSITFFIDPGNRAYVRRITYSGNSKTRDEVLRREMRQHEGGWVSTPKVERGKVRLQRLGYFSEVDVETPAVPGTTDQVDVNYTVTERPFGNFTAGLGYSQFSGLIVQTSVTQNNFMGSGNRIQFAFSNSRVNRRLSLGYLNPYYTIDGVSRGLNLNYSETQGLDAGITAFDNRVFGGGVSFGIPISEYNSISTNFNYENTRLSPDGFFAPEVQEFIDRNGNQFDIYRVQIGFSNDTRNRTVLPTAGYAHSVVSEVTVPLFGNTLEFYKLSYFGQLYIPLVWDFVFAMKADLGYGDAFEKGEDLPFFENYYAGGPRSVRGYQQNTLGPRDRFGRPLGGNVKITGSSELIVPLAFLPDEMRQSVRVAFFVDGGNVFNSNNIELQELRTSAGLGATWLSPFGIMSISYATLFDDRPGDFTEQFQFNFGTSF